MHEMSSEVKKSALKGAEVEIGFNSHLAHIVSSKAYTWIRSHIVLNRLRFLCTKNT